MTRLTESLPPGSERAFCLYLRQGDNTFGVIYRTWSDSVTPFAFRVAIDCHAGQLKSAGTLFDLLYGLFSQIGVVSCRERTARLLTDDGDIVEELYTLTFVGEVNKTGISIWLTGMCLTIEGFLYFAQLLEQEGTRV